MHSQANLQPSSEKKLKRVRSSAGVSVNIPNLKKPLSLDNLLAITRDWNMTNQRRMVLIEKKLAECISTEENQELAMLQDLAGVKRQLLMPLPIRKLAAIEASLRKANKWRGG